MELGPQYLHLRGFLSDCIPGGSDIMISQEFFYQHKQGSSPCTAAKLRTGRSRTPCTRGSTSSAEVTALTRYVGLQVASAKGNVAHKLSNSGSGLAGVSISALLCPSRFVLMLLGLQRSWYHRLFQDSWSFILLQSLYLGLSCLISLSANSGLKMRGPG